LITNIARFAKMTPPIDWDALAEDCLIGVFSGFEEDLRACLDERDAVFIDGSACVDEESLHTTLASALEFPDWYGRNWDALWDLMRDLHRTSRDLTVVVTRSEQLARNCPDGFRFVVHDFAHAIHLFQARWKRLSLVLQTDAPKLCAPIAPDDDSDRFEWLFIEGSGRTCTAMFSTQKAAATWVLANRKSGELVRNVPGRGLGDGSSQASGWPTDTPHPRQIYEKGIKLPPPVFREFSPGGRVNG
jgi:RNAse (barnase) inhibitor barstar